MWVFKVLIGGVGLFTLLSVYSHRSTNLNYQVSSKRQRSSISRNNEWNGWMDGLDGLDALFVQSVNQSALNESNNNIPIQLTHFHSHSH